jgi:hypothetical protein
MINKNELALLFIVIGLIGFGLAISYLIYESFGLIESLSVIFVLMILIGVFLYDDYYEENKEPVTSK